MALKYWAKAGNSLIGPFETRNGAIESMRDRQADKRPLPDYMARARKNQILTGYGEFGPHFDMQWVDAYNVTMAKRDLDL
jgi:hypothetical protein